MVVWTPVMTEQCRDWTMLYFFWCNCLVFFYYLQEEYKGGGGYGKITYYLFFILQANKKQTKAPQKFQLIFGNQDQTSQRVLKLVKWNTKLVILLFYAVMIHGCTVGVYQLFKGFQRTSSWQKYYQQSCLLAVQYFTMQNRHNVCKNCMKESKNWNM